jgi:beta-N-acetylhexosaminidase
MTWPWPRSLLSRRRLLAAALAVGYTATGHSGSGARAQETEVDAIVAEMTPGELAGRMFMLPVAGTALTAEEDAWLRALRPGGVILTGANFGTSDETRSLVAAIHATNPELPPLVALDQEGGIVSPLAEDPAPGAPAMGQLGGPEISALARARADLVASYGFDVNFAPVADVAFGPDSFMAGRAFGADPAIVAEDIAAYLAGTVGSGVLHCAKHFPGHGRVAVDSHLALPVLDIDQQVWWDQDALPFRAAVEAGVPMVMLGHLLVPTWGELPASLSPAAVRILREDLGFAGVVVSDDLGMGALASWGPLEVVDLAVAAGVDLLLFVILGVAPEALVDHLAQRIEAGEVAMDRIAASVSRLLERQLGRPA